MLGWEMWNHLEEHYKKGRINQLASDFSLTSTCDLAFNDLHYKHQGVSRHITPNILNHHHI